MAEEEEQEEQEEQEEEVYCEKYELCPASIDTVSYYICGMYQGRQNRYALSRSTAEMLQMQLSDIMDTNNFISQEQLPDIFSTEKNEFVWNNVYVENGELKQNEDWQYDTKLEKLVPCVKNKTYRSNRSFTNLVKIQDACTVHRVKGKDWSGNTIAKVKKNTPISLENRMGLLYESIYTELAAQDRRNDYDNNHDVDTVMPALAPKGSMPAYLFKSGKYVTTSDQFVKNDIIYDLNNALMVYNENVQEIEVTKEVINADDSINKLIDNYKNNFIADCICYSDCNSYSVCYCYGNCNHY